MTKIDKEIIETYCNNELDLLLKKPNVKMCNFLLAVGCRLNSLINIRVEDIDFINNMVYLNTAKNRKALIIPLSETIVQILKEYINIRKGGYIFRLQKILGHSDIEVVRNYVEMFAEDLKKDFD